MEEVGSLNHSAIQANLAFLLKRLGIYSVCVNLSLDIGNVDASQFDLILASEIQSDVSLYPKRKLDPVNDILQMTEMPLLTIEIVSPMQGIHEILEKFKLYFTLNIQSCWLVIPSTQTVTVYSAPDQFRTFGEGEVLDEVLNIHLPIAEIFE